MRENHSMINKSLHVTFRGVLSTILILVLHSAVDARNEGTLLRLKVTDSVGNIKRGSGFVVSGHNYIITAYHVVQNARRIDIDRPTSFHTDNLEVISYYPDTDIALLKIPDTLRWTLVPFNSGRSGASSSKVLITVVGYGSVIDRPQKYTGYHENTPFVPSELWTRPPSMPGRSSRLFNISGVRLLMLQAPTPYGVSGGPVINSAGKVIGVVSGALTRVENVTSLGWAISIDYALRNVSHLHGIQPANVAWPALKLITDENIYLRVFGGPEVSLIAKLRCPDSIERINTAWDATAYAIADLQGYLTSARVAVDVAARQARSREDANRIINAQVSLLKERFAKVRDDATAYKRQIVVAATNCNRDIDAIEQAIGRLPRTDHNERLKGAVTNLAKEIVSNVNTRIQENMENAEYEIQKQYARFASIEPLSDEGSSFLSRPSRSIESDIHEFVQYIDVMQSILQSVYLGVYKDIYRDLESDLNSYLLWIESANRQPWDRS